MLTRSRERKPREHESHVSSRQVRKEIVYQKGCYQVRARVPGVWAHLRVRHLSTLASRKFGTRLAEGACATPSTTHSVL